MSKSLGNFITIRDLLKEYDGDVFRFFVLSTHYRSPIDFSKDSLHQAKKSLERIKNYINTLNQQVENNNISEDEINNSIPTNEIPSNLIDNFFNAMDDDFNTPKAISNIFEFIKKFNNLESYNNESIAYIKKFFNDIIFILGLDFNTSNNDDATEYINLILNIREKLRANKQYDLSDEIRDELNNLGINVSDN